MANERAKAIGERLKARREQLQLTQEEVARRTDAPGITGNVISRWERGKNRPSDGNLEEMATALEIDAGYLRFGNDRPVVIPPPADNGQLLDRLAGIEARLGELVGIFSVATAPGLEALVAGALRDLGVDPALLRTSPAAPPPAGRASKPRARRRQAGD